jgi:hypothetical protein
MWPLQGCQLAVQCWHSCGLLLQSVPFAKVLFLLSLLLLLPGGRCLVTLDAGLIA